MPVVATNDVRFIRAEDFESHEARVCIQKARWSAIPAPPPLQPEQYLKSPREMARLFDDVPEALANSVEIARRCNLELKLGKSRAARVPRAGGRHRRLLREELARGLRERLQR